METSEEKMLNRYRLLGQLEKGGMGEVYLAEDTGLRRQVALKLLPEEFAQRPERLKRFEREARILAALSHPNIVEVYSLEEAGDVRFLTMELVEGQTLRELIPEGGMPLEQFFDVAIPLADALGSAHQKGILHRDLKPGNVMVSDELGVKVLDFGLAKLSHAGPEVEEDELPTGSLESGGRREEVSATADLPAEPGSEGRTPGLEDFSETWDPSSELSGSPGGDPGRDVTDRTELPLTTLTQPGRVLGTVPYMSPEQVHGWRLDSRSDIFSLGTLLYEMATGQRPFQGRSTTEVLTAILTSRPRALRVEGSPLWQELWGLLRRCLEKNPDQRVQSAFEVRDELQRLRREMRQGPPRGGEAGS